MAALQSIIDGLSLMDGVSKAISDLQNSQPSWNGGPFLKRLREMKRDLVYLKSELDRTKDRIERLQSMVRTLLIGRKPQLIVLSSALLLIN